MRRVLLVVAVMIVALVRPAAGQNLIDTKIGFSLTIPAGFERLTDLSGGTPNVMYAFRSTGEPGAINIERMGGVLGRDRLNPEQMRALAPAGLKFRLITARWNGFEIDGMESTISQNGVTMLVVAAQVPLKPEAIQVVVGGDLGEPARVRAVLDQVLSSLKGQTNWLGSVAPASLANSTNYGNVLLGAAIGGLLLGLGAFWVLRRVAPRGTVFLAGFVLYIAGMSMQEERVREWLMLRGMVKLLGLAGMVAGGVDVVLRRTPKKSGTATVGGDSNTPSAEVRQAA
jgi:hypothetical protein